MVHSAAYARLRTNAPKACTPLSNTMLGPVFVVLGVTKKYDDDYGGNFAVQLTYQKSISSIH